MKVCNKRKTIRRNKWWPWHDSFAEQTGKQKGRESTKESMAMAEESFVQVRERERKNLRRKITVTLKKLKECMDRNGVKAFIRNQSRELEEWLSRGKRRPVRPLLWGHAGHGATGTTNRTYRKDRKGIGGKPKTSGGKKNQLLSYLKDQVEVRKKVRG